MSALEAAPAQAPRAGLLKQVADATTVLSVILTFALSAFTLQYIGIAYLVEGGSQFQKVHPATWLAMLAVGLNGLRAGNPVTYFAIMGGRFSGTAIFLVVLVFVVAYNTLVQKSPVSLYLDTFVAPALLLWLMCDLSVTSKSGLRLFIHVFMFANACLGVYELRTGFRLTPYVVVGTQIETIVTDWRSSALLGHPLANSTTSAIYMLALLLSRNVNNLARFGLVAVQLVAMNSFGGRAATLIVLVAFALLIAWRLLDIARGARFAIGSAAMTVLAVPVTVAAVLISLDAGFFDQFIDRISNDGNSAKARLLMFTLFENMSLDTFLFGSNAETVMTRQFLEGFEYGIESFWIASVIAQGLLMSLFLWGGMFLFFADLVKATSRRTLGVLALAILIASTSLSLAGKGSMLLLVVCFAILFLEDARGQKA